MANHDQPGLRLRLAHEARRIAGQHQYLDALESTTLRALERGTAVEMADALRGFSGALLAHFGIEEQVQFPALHGLDPGLGPELEALERDHVGFRADLEALRERVGGRDPVRRGAVLSDFSRLALALRHHEEREEALLAKAPTG